MPEVISLTTPQSPLNPGSVAAWRAGCRCGILDNCFGAGVGGGRYWISSACPLHGIATTKEEAQNDR